MQNFRLSTAQVKFHQLCTLIGYVCWKYIQFPLKNSRGLMFYNTKAYRALKSPFRAKYMTLDLKKCRGVIFHETKSHAKFEEKLTCG